MLKTDFQNSTQNFIQIVGTFIFISVYTNCYFLLRIIQYCYKKLKIFWVSIYQINLLLYSHQNWFFLQDGNTTILLARKNFSISQNFSISKIISINEMAESQYPVAFQEQICSSIFRNSQRKDMHIEKRTINEHFSNKKAVSR